MIGAMHVLRYLPERLGGVPCWIGLIVLAAAVSAAAQVPVSKEPRHRVSFENKQLRILDVNIPPGDKSLDHRHDLDIATVSMTMGTTTRVQSGTQPAAERPSRPLGDASITEYAGKASSHTIENVGKSPYQLFAVENLKTGGWSTAPAASGLATKMTRESRAFRLYDVNLSRETSQTAHTHAVPTIAVLISGSAMSDGPDTQAKANPGAPIGLKQLTQPGQWILVPGGDTHHMVRLGPGEARIVEIEVR
jgi:quercetin dioxygenase-like cupin family protein